MALQVQIVERSRIFVLGAPRALSFGRTLASIKCIHIRGELPRFSNSRGTSINTISIQPLYCALSVA